MVQFYSGSMVNVAVKMESTYGTNVGSFDSSNWTGGHVQNVSLSSNNNLVEVHSAGARATQQIIPTMYDVEGSMDMMYQNGRMFAYALGTDTSPSGTNPTTHTIGLADVIKSFTMIISQDATADAVWTITGCKISRLRVSSDLSGPVMLHVDFIAQSAAYAESGTVSYASVTDTVMAPQFAPNGSGVFVYNSTVIAQIQNVDWGVDNHLHKVHAAGVRQINALVEGERSGDFRATIVGEQTMLNALAKQFQDPSSSGLPYTPALGDLTGQTLAIQWDNYNALGATATRSLVISLTGCKIDSANLSVPVDGLVSLDISGKFTTFGASPTVVKDTFATTYLA